MVSVPEWNLVKGQGFRYVRVQLRYVVVRKQPLIGGSVNFGECKHVALELSLGVVLEVVSAS